MTDSTVKDRVVVTFWLSDRAKLDGKRPIQHAYGPYTLSEARKVKKEFDAEPLPEPGMAFASVCKPIDVGADGALDNKENSK